MITHAIDPERALLRHTIATLAYRGGKAMRGAPESFSSFKIGDPPKTPGQILAHISDLLDWAITTVRRQAGVERFQAADVGPGRGAFSRNARAPRRPPRRRRRPRRICGSTLSRSDRRRADPRRADQHVAATGGCADQGRELPRVPRLRLAGSGRSRRRRAGSSQLACAASNLPSAPSMDRSASPAAQAPASPRPRRPRAPRHRQKRRRVRRLHVEQLRRDQPREPERAGRARSRRRSA